MSFSSDLTSNSSLTSSSNTTTTSSEKKPSARSTTANSNDSLGFVRKLLSVTTKKSPTSFSDEVIMHRNETKDKMLLRQSAIDEEPDSMESVISDPSSFPITIVPPATTGGAGLLIRNSTQHSSFSRLSRISSTSK